MALQIPEAMKNMFEQEGLELSEAELAALDRVDQPLDLLVSAWGPAFYGLYSARILERALNKHAQALVQSAEASDRYADRLNKATWGLAFATAVLAIASVANFIV